VAIFRRRLAEPASPARPADDIAAAVSGASRPDPEPQEHDRAEGPRDRAEVTSVAGLLDFGSLLVQPREGMQLHLETDESGEALTGVTVLVDGSAVQLQVFAAPRSGGEWPDIRNEIAQSIAQQGGTADIVDGLFGRELLARMPQGTPDGRTVFAPARFIGIDGPRWFLRAVVSGAGAADPARSEAAMAVIRSTVVNRGDQPMAPRDLLPLHLPTELKAPSEEPATDDYVGNHRNDPLRPFERGPEITEIH
jgi:hypothetical protein